VQEEAISLLPEEQVCAAKQNYWNRHEVFSVLVLQRREELVTTFVFVAHGCHTVSFLGDALGLETTPPLSHRLHLLPMRLTWEKNIAIDMNFLLSILRIHA
jgi:hypothetical protein